MFRKSVVILLAGTALALGCRKAPEAPPPAPTLHQLDDPAVFDWVTVRWDGYDATRPVEGWEVEGRLPPASFAVLHGAALPASERFLALELDPETPELVDLEFRVRSLPDGPWSSVAVLHRGIRAPVFTGPRPNGTALEVEWENRSAVADGVVLERRVSQPDQTALPWEPLPVTGPQADSYTDTDLGPWTDGTALEYRIAATKGARASAWATSGTGRSALAAPSVREGEPLPGGTRLTWTAPSRWVTEYVIERVELGDVVFEEVARVAPSATPWEDWEGDLGLYRYLVRARSALTYPYIESERSSVLVARTPPRDWGFSAKVVAASQGVIARGTRGIAAAFGLGWTSVDSPSYRPPGDAVQAYLSTPAGSKAWMPGVLVDGNGWPHAVFARGPASRTLPVPIVHAWHDGTAWREEEIARRVISDGDGTELVRFTIGSDGTLHASWQCGPDPSLGLEVATRDPSGAWQVENLSAVLGAYRWKNHFLAGDGGGAPHLVTADWDGTLVHVARGPSGWQAEPVPTGGPVAVGFVDDTFLAFLAGGDRLVLAYHDAPASPAEASEEVRVLERGPAGWGTPVTVKAQAWSAVAVSPDGSRIAIVDCPGSQVESRVTILASGGETALRFYSLHGSPVLGFAPDNKVWVLDRSTTDHRDYPDPQRTSVLFEER